MDGGILALILTGTGLLGGAIGWLSSQYWQHRQAKRQAADDASKILNEKKKLLTEMISDTKKVKQRKELKAQLEEVNAALLGLHAERLQSTLKDAGLPPENALIEEGRAMLQPQQVSELEEEIAAVESLPPSDLIWDPIALGNAYYYAEQYEAAEDIYDRILNLKPNDPIALMNRGITYGQLGRYENALTDLNRSLKIRPDDPDILSNRGATYIHLGRYNYALTDLNRSLKIRPANPDALQNRGSAYIHIGSYDNALTDLSHSLEIRPDNPAALNDRGVAYIKLGRYDEALADLNRSLEIRPSDAYIPYNLACLFSLWGKTKDALAYLEKAIYLDKQCREDAKTDEDFNNIRNDPRFKKLVGEA